MPRTPRKKEIDDVPSADEAEGVYVVEKIMGKRQIRGRIEYYIKWQGYPESQNTWERASNVYAQNLIDAFERGRAEVKTENSASSADGGKDDDTDEFSPARLPRRKQPRSAPKTEDALTNYPKTVKVRTVTRDPTTKTLMVHLNAVGEGSELVLPNHKANKLYPQEIISFYESRIKFKETSASAST